MVTAIYQRASDIKQDEDGISIETQNETVKKFCEYKEYTNLKYYNEIKSARTLKGRDQLESLIEDIENGYIKRVVIYRLDRLTRSLRDLMNLLHLFEENECELHSTYENIDTSTPSGRMLVQVLGMIAEWESANTSMRVKNSMMYQAQQGRWMAVAPYGFSLVDGKLIINEEERRLLKRAFDLILNEGYSFAAAEHYMNTHYNTEWKPDFLTRKVEQESTAGNTYRAGQVFYDTHEPLLSSDDINALKELKSNRIAGRDNLGHNDIFRLRIICFICGNRLSLNAHKRQYGYYYNYHCSQCYKRKRGSVSVSESTVEQALIRYMGNLPIVLDDIKTEKTDEEKQYAELNNRLIELDKRKDRIQRAWINEMMSDDDLKKYQDEIKREENNIMGRLDNLQATRDISSKELKEIKALFTDHYKKLTRNEKVKFVQQHIKEIHFKRTSGNVMVSNIVFL